MGELLADDALLLRSPGLVAHLHGEEHHALVQHLVVVEVVQQRVGRGVGRGGEEHRRSGHALRRLDEQRLEEGLERHRGASHPREEMLAAAPPGGHHRKDRRPDDQREPAAVGDLQQGRREECQIDDEEEAGREHAQPQRVAPQVAHDEEGEQRVDQHRRRDRDAIGAGEARGGAEAHHRRHHRRAQHPVHARDVDLAELARRGVDDVHARQEAELHRLVGDRVGARDHRLRSDHGSGGGERHHRIERPARHEQVERVLHRLGLDEQQRALAEIVQHQRGGDETEPADAHRLLAEVPHVGIERLGAGHGEDHRAEHDEGLRHVAGEEGQRVQRVERREDLRRARDAADSGGADGDEPSHGDRAEEAPHRRGAAPLQEEEREQHADGDRHDVGLQRRGADLQPLDRREHRNRRREHRVAVEERRAEGADQQQRNAPLRMVADRRLREGDERHDAALAAVVGAHNEEHVLQRHDDHQRPEHRRQAADYVGRVERDGMAGGEGLLDRVERAGADIAEDDAQGGEGQGRGGALAGFGGVGQAGGNVLPHRTKGKFTTAGGGRA